MVGEGQIVINSAFKILLLFFVVGVALGYLAQAVVVCVQ